MCRTPLTSRGLWASEEGRRPVGDSGPGAEARPDRLVPERGLVSGQWWATGPGRECTPSRAWGVTPVPTRGLPTTAGRPVRNELMAKATSHPDHGPGQSHHVWEQSLWEGGLSAWESQGSSVSREATPLPQAGAGGSGVGGLQAKGPDSGRPGPLRVGTHSSSRKACWTSDLQAENRPKRGGQ